MDYNTTFVYWIRTQPRNRTCVNWLGADTRWSLYASVNLVDIKNVCRLTASIHYPNSWLVAKISLIARFMGPTWGPSGADSTQVGPMLAPWTLLSGIISKISQCVCRGKYLWNIFWKRQSLSHFSQPFSENRTSTGHIHWNGWSCWQNYQNWLYRILSFRQLPVSQWRWFRQHNTPVSPYMVNLFWYRCNGSNASTLMDHTDAIWMNLISLSFSRGMWFLPCPPRVRPRAGQTRASDDFCLLKFCGQHGFMSATDWAFEF